MGDLTKNISRHELACQCGCGLDTMDWETLEKVQEVCIWAESILKVDKVILKINSACRCEDHNTAIGGSDNSQHTKCRAIDFAIKNMDPAMIHTYLVGMYMDRYGIGEYQTFTHLDTRSNGPARWKG